MKLHNVFYEPGYIAAIELSLRRTLVLKNSYELLAMSFQLTLVYTARSSQLAAHGYIVQVCDATGDQ